MFDVVIALLLTWMAPVECPESIQDPAPGLVCLQAAAVPFDEFEALLPSELVWERRFLMETASEPIATAAEFEGGGGVAYLRGGLALIAPAP